MNPCAETYYIPNAWFFREALLSLMLQEDIGTQEVSERLGISIFCVQRYISMNRCEAKTAKPMQYPQQFLIELMLDEDTRARLMQGYASTTRRATWHAESTR